MFCVSGNSPGCAALFVFSSASLSAVSAFQAKVSAPPGTFPDAAAGMPETPRETETAAATNALTIFLFITVSFSLALFFPHTFILTNCRIIPCKNITPPVGTSNRQNFENSVTVQPTERLLKSDFQPSDSKEVLHSLFHLIHIANGRMANRRRTDFLNRPRNLSAGNFRKCIHLFKIAKTVIFFCVNCMKNTSGKFVRAGCGKHHRAVEHQSTADASLGG